MEWSFLKALSATVRGQVSSLKSQSKRLHAASANIFGQTFPIDTCKEAVAVANGYRNWREVSNLAMVTGQDRSTPTWKIQYRSELHEAMLKAFVETDLHVSDLRPVVLLGSNGTTAKPAVCLWAEQISAMRAPGVVVIDTMCRTFQSTEIGMAARVLGLGDLFQRFRVIDAREPSIPSAITATTRQWLAALQSGLSQDELERLTESRVLVHFELLLDMFGAKRVQSGREDFDFYAVDQALKALRVPSMIKAHMDSQEMREGPGREYLADNFLNDSKFFDHAVVEKLSQMIEQTAQRISSHGVVLSLEALHRPTIVLCDARDPISMVVATLVSSMYCNRHPDHWGMLPVLYWGAAGSEQLPALLGSGANAIIAVEGCDARAALWSGKVTREPVFVTAEEDGIVVSGKWADTMTESAVLG